MIDPHGEFVDELLETIPDNRKDDVIYFNPADTDYPMGFNILEVKDPDHKHLVASGLMSIFTKIWANVWSARMEYILNNAVLALIDTPGANLLGIPRMLVDKIYRQIVVNNCKDPVVRSYWINEYEQYEAKFRTEAISPIQNKVGQFLSTHIIRNVVGQSRSTLDIDDAMQKKKIILVNVSKGKIGEDNSALLGAMIITKIQLAAMERVRLKQDQRPDFLLYVDEFQNFATDSFASILSEARKYRLGMIISHQYIGQLITDTGKDKLKDAIFGNVGTTITFRVGAQDAEFLSNHYAPEVEQMDLINLPNHCVYLRLLINGVASRPFSATTLPPIQTNVSKEHTKMIIDMSRKNYAKPRQQVENEISMWAGIKSQVQIIKPDPIKKAAAKPLEVENQGSHTNEEIKTMKEARVNPIRVMPKYETDLSGLGIDIGEDVTTYQEVKPPIPDSVSLGELEGQEPKKKRKRKRKHKNKSGIGLNNQGELRDALSTALGLDTNMYPLTEVDRDS